MKFFHFIFLLIILPVFLFSKPNTNKIFFEIHGLKEIPYYLTIAKNQVDWISTGDDYLFIYLSDDNYDGKSMYNWILSNAVSGTYYGTDIPKTVKDNYGPHPKKGNKKRYAEHIGRVIKDKKSRKDAVNE